ncbi:2-methylfumaryl-CoA isomerase [Amycolatopsis acidicola]|uniref:2-methylfumaryl-CoA isomerase n=1 Tax=Amycolatopsis acidicola TaxID=2596893 RepID=A0A5N0ULS5_9PSEU|nr:CoA transferase [Amycolatopsis acidicola]KAA9150211.1 2-methylfumaryl-CoA isomerase [Amycolatopsis acidicola]
MSGPLAGLRVVEVSAYVATPLAGMTLAQLGADVVRVEPVGGQADRTRLPLSGSGTSLYWSGLNKGKRAIEVDFRSAEGRSLVADLVADRGILVTNTRRFPELSYVELAKRRPDVIHVLLNGNRDGGTGVDYTVQASVGLHGITGPADTDGPVLDTLPFWDVACGLYLAIGLLAAERERRDTGQGQSVEVALRDVAMATLGNLGFLTEAQLGGVRPRAGNYVYGLFGRDFATKDGARLMVVVLTQRHWRQLLEVTGLAAAVDALGAALDVDFSRENTRYEHRATLAALLEPWFAARTKSEVTKALSGTSVLHDEFRSISELVAGLGEEELFARLDQPGIGEHWAPGSPLVMNGRAAPARVAPAVGEHTGEVLAELENEES